MTLKRLLAVLALMLAVPAFAEEAAAPAAEAPTAAEKPPPYLAAMVNTTLMYMAPGSPVLGPLGDITPSLGFGLFITETLALEIDVNLTLVPTVSPMQLYLALQPGIVWAFHPNFYAALRVPVYVYPAFNVGIVPGFGGTMVFGRWAPFIEFNPIATFVGAGKPDFGIGITVGTLFNL